MPGRPHLHGYHLIQSWSPWVRVDPLGWGAHMVVSVSWRHYHMGLRRARRLWVSHYLRVGLAGRRRWVHPYPGGQSLRVERAHCSTTHGLCVSGAEESCGLLFLGGHEIAPLGPLTWRGCITDMDFHSEHWVFERATALVTITFDLPACSHPPALMPYIITFDLPACSHPPALMPYIITFELPACRSGRATSASVSYGDLPYPSTALRYRSIRHA